MCAVFVAVFALTLIPLCIFFLIRLEGVTSCWAIYAHREKANNRCLLNHIFWLKCQQFFCCCPWECVGYVKNKICGTFFEGHWRQSLCVKKKRIRLSPCMYELHVFKSGNNPFTFRCLVLWASLIALLGKESTCNGGPWLFSQAISPAEGIGYHSGILALGAIRGLYSPWSRKEPLCIFRSLLRQRYTLLTLNRRCEANWSDCWRVSHRLEEPAGHGGSSQACQAWIEQS